MMHPLRLSVSNIDINMSKEIIDISIKVFKDDLGNIIMQQYGLEVNLNECDDVCDSLVNDYVLQRFKVFSSDQKQENLMFKEVNQNTDAVFLVYQVKGFSKTGKLIIENQILFDLYQDQKNLVFVNLNEKNNGYNLSIDEPKLIFEY